MLIFLLLICREESFCDGTAPTCPLSQVKPNKTVCNKEFVCYKGECTGSICLAYGLESCQCTQGMTLIRYILIIYKHNLLVQVLAKCFVVNWCNLFIEPSWIFEIKYRYHKTLDIHISFSSYYPDNSVISLKFDFKKTIMSKEK